IIERRLTEEENFRRCRSQTRVIHAPLQNVPGERTYDYMISGLPLNNFALTLVEEIFKSYERLLKPHGVLSYFEYLAIRSLKAAVVAAERERLMSLGAYLDQKIRAHQVGEDVVLWNVPPAVARHFSFGK